VGLVIIGLVFAYLVPAPAGSQGFTGIYLEQVILYGGNASVYSFSQPCSGDSQLDITLLNNSTSTISMTNITLYGGRLSENSTVLVPISNGCLPVAQNNPPISPSSSTELMLYPAADFPLFPLPRNCNAEIQFSNGQNFSVTGLVPGPLENQ
jgi:hypothetical protein